jgi:type I restriction enzyme M protein
MVLMYGSLMMPRGRPRNGAERGATAKPTKGNGNGANLGFEAQLFLAADKLRKNLEPSDYKHVALGLIFLKHISNAFEAKHAHLLTEDPTAAEDPDEYLADNVFGCQRRRAGHTSRPVPSSRPSAS